ncbi:hypothetical protein F5J12DRAFT_969109 [Pisolithus orientalis]|uniref:uncharacterized protein n=1 Tax=Pisolithus orientalis TaxID=936130 RepID=UPI002225386E|nr:uncharacterized protein F5J12DRAFT_969109 [Pisolithus orientalis]KAI5988937.1 hypothetical protein F5J12DRAFT_969109 [Pisolithus orientalis]
MDVWPAMAVLLSIAFSVMTTRNKMNANFKERKTLVSAHNATILHKLNVQLPSDCHVTMQILGDIMAILLQILKFYLGLLSDAWFVGLCKDAYFGVRGAEDDDEGVDAVDEPLLAYTQTPCLEASLAASDIDQFAPFLLSQWAPNGHA